MSEHSLKSPPTVKSKMYKTLKRPSTQIISDDEDDEDEINRSSATKFNHPLKDIKKEEV